MRGYKLIFLITILLSTTSAQLQTYIHLDQAYESNPFRYPDPQESWTSVIEAALQYNLSLVSVSYTGSYTLFTNFSERDYLWHQAAVFSTWENTRAGIYFNQRLNKSDYSLYNYYSFNGYINHSFALSSLNIYLAANGVINQYSELSDINNYELHSSVRLNRSFQTRTTLIGGLAIHYKKYTTSYSYLDTLTNYSSGMGPGGGQTASKTLIQNIEVEAPSVSQFQYWLRAAQSLSQGTGLAVQYNARLSLKGSARYLAGLPYNYFDESEIFDDPMGYDLNSFGLELTQILPARFTLKTSFYIGKKMYTSQGIYLDEINFDESILRDDHYNTAQLSLKKVFSLGQTGFTMEIWYQWLNNKSNSYWYNYENHFTSLSLSISF